MAAAGQVLEAQAMVTIAVPSDPSHVTHLLRDQIDTITAQAGTGAVGRAAVPHPQALFKDVAEQRLKDGPQHRISPTARGEDQ